MTSKTSGRFRLAFGRLPARIQTRARTAYRLFRQDPSHPSLRFKQVHATRPISLQPETKTARRRERAAMLLELASLNRPLLDEILRKHGLSF